MRILLVDDSRTVSMLFSARLRAFGHEVFLAENGSVAVEKFRDLAPDLLLMDIEMPVMNGFDATNRIREIEKSRKWAWTPIIFLTSASTTENFVTSVKAGGDDLIPKEIPESALRAKLDAMARVANLRQELFHANQQMEQDIKARNIAETQLSERLAELTELNQTLKAMQTQLIQTEKLASIGQLAAGVAHEINTPIGFVLSNLGTLRSYFENMASAVRAYEQAATAEKPAAGAGTTGLRKEFDLDFIEEDAPALIEESRSGVLRIGHVVQSLRDFAQLDSDQDVQWTDIHQGLDATIDLVAGKFEIPTKIVKEYGNLPNIECRPMQLNQVFMNLLINAAQAICAGEGTITIRTGTCGENEVWLEIQDDGCGIPEENREKIFDPFFTTRPVGKGAGLGLSLSYGIIKNHNGRIEVESAEGKGSCFRVVLPVRR